MKVKLGLPHSWAITIILVILAQVVGAADVSRLMRVSLINLSSTQMDLGPDSFLSSTEKPLLACNT